MQRDVCVLSFADTSEHTAQRVSELCGIELLQARRLLRSVPAVLARNVAPATATALERELMALGAEVVVQASAAQTSARGSAPPPAESPPPAPGSEAALTPAASPPARSSGIELADVPPAAPPAAQGSGIELEDVPPLAPRLPRSVAPRPFVPLSAPPTPLAPPASSFFISRRAVVLGGAALAVAGGYLWWRPSKIGGLEVRKLGKGGDGSPTLILLHGFGAPADDLVGLGEEVLGAANLGNAVRVLFPAGITRVGMGRAWYNSREDVEEARAKLSALLKELIDDGTPPERIMLGGFSQGGTMAMDVGLSFRPRLYGVVVLSGGRIPGVDWSAELSSTEKTRFLITHGRGDGVLPFRQAEDTAKALQQSNADVSLLLFKGSHRIVPEARAELARFFGEMVNSSGG